MSLKAQLALAPTATRGAREFASSPGSEEERRKLERYRSDILRNHSDRIQVKRSIIDLDAMQAKNHNEVRVLEDVAGRWKGENADVHPEDTPREIRMAKLEMETLMANIAKNEESKTKMYATLSNYEAEALRQQRDFPKEVVNEVRRPTVNPSCQPPNLSGVGPRRTINMELEEGALADEAAKKERDETIYSLQRRIQARDKVIAEYTKFIDKQDLRLPVEVLSYLAQLDDEPGLNYVRHRDSSRRGGGHGLNGPTDAADRSSVAHEGRVPQTRGNESVRFATSTGEEWAGMVAQRKSNAHGPIHADCAAARMSLDDPAATTRKPTASTLLQRRSMDERRFVRLPISTRYCKVSSLRRRKVEQEAAATGCRSNGSAMTGRVPSPHRLGGSNVFDGSNVNSSANGNPPENGSLKQRRASVLAGLLGGRRTSVTSPSGGQLAPKPERRRRSSLDVESGSPAVSAGNGWAMAVAGEAVRKSVA
eukprot:scaffold418_cov386-Prasinococcus_capsulatus_cf.AAC.28